MEKYESRSLHAATMLCSALLLLFCASMLSGCGAQSSAVAFSLPSGCYAQEEVTLKIAGGQDRTIVYTLDGSTPTTDSPRYTEPIVLHDRSGEPSILFTPENVAQMTFDGSTVNDGPQFPKANIVRAASVSADGEIGPVVTGTFFVGVDPVKRFPELPVISIVTDPANLLDYETGILVRGAVYDAWEKTAEGQQVIAKKDWFHFKANATQKGRDWERPVDLELISNGQSMATAHAGLRLKGNFSRVYLQRSMNLYLRDEYGTPSLDYPLIPEAYDVNGAEIQSYSRFCLRNGGNDTPYLKFRDAFLQSLAHEYNVDTLASTPVIVYLNGESMSAYSLQERYGAEYFAKHYGVDPDEVVFIKEQELEEGEDADYALYEELLAFADEDLAQPATWERFEQAVDIESMLDYCAIEIYVGNIDWKPERNTLLWRTRGTDPATPAADGRWRFCLYDLDLSANFYTAAQYSYDTDDFAQALQDHPVLAAAIRNPEFAQQLLARIDELGKTSFAPARISAELDVWTSNWKPMVDDYRARFGGSSDQWDKRIALFDEYFSARHDAIVGHVKRDLGLS